MLGLLSSALALHHSWCPDVGTMLACLGGYACDEVPPAHCENYRFVCGWGWGWGDVFILEHNEAGESSTQSPETALRPHLCTLRVSPPSTPHCLEALRRQAIRHAPNLGTWLSEPMLGSSLTLGGGVQGLCLELGYLGRAGLEVSASLIGSCLGNGCEWI